MTYYYNQRNYSNIKYPSKNHPNATISSSGCGVCSVAICINTLAQKELYTISSLTKLALNSGAREAEGTNVSTLLKAINKEHNEFTFSTTNYESVLYNHLKNGGLAIANQGDAYNVFSSQGHFVACVGIENNYIKVYDVYMYDGKYSQSPRNKRIIKPLNYGCVVSLTEIDKACGDRNPSYYLISMKEAPKKQNQFTIKIVNIN